MLITLWIVNIILAAVFLAAGVTKIARPREKLAASGMAWTATTPAAAVKLIGAAETIGAIGLILPLATGVAAILTPLAAVGLAVVMAGAIVVHVRRRENSLAPAALLLLAAVSAVFGFLTL